MSSQNTENNTETTLLEGLRVDVNADRPVNTQTHREGEIPVQIIEYQTSRCSGVVKWFNPTKGFGFITPEDGGADVFVHQSEIQLGGFRSLAQGEYVEYDLLNGEKGPKALSVTGPDGAAPKGAPRQQKVMFIDGDKTYFASENKKVQQLLIGNQIPVYTSLSSSHRRSAVPYTATNHYVKRNVQYSPLSPKQLGFVHSPVATTHSSFHFYSPHDYPLSYSGVPTTPPGSKIVDPNSPVASPQFHFPVTQNVPLSPTFTGYHHSFSYPLSSPTPHYTQPHPSQQYTHGYQADLLTQGLGDLSLSNIQEPPSYV